MEAMLKLLAVSAAALLTFAYAVAVELRADHPDTYVVKKGDIWASPTLPRSAMAVAGNLAGQPADREPHLIYQAMC